MVQSRYLELRISRELYFTYLEGRMSRNGEQHPREENTADSKIEGKIGKAVTHCVFFSTSFINQSKPFSLASCTNPLTTLSLPWSPPPPAAYPLSPSPPPFSPPMNDYGNVTKNAGVTCEWLALFRIPYRGVEPGRDPSVVGQFMSVH